MQVYTRNTKKIKKKAGNLFLMANNQIKTSRSNCWNDERGGT